MKTFQITFTTGSKAVETKVETKTVTVQASDKKAAASQAKIQGICHWSAILEVKEIN